MFLSTGLEIKSFRYKNLFYLLEFKPFIYRGIEILKNDVAAILSQIFDLKFRTQRHFTMPPGTEFQIRADCVKNSVDNTQSFVDPK